MEKKEKILLASTCALGAVSIVFISLFAWKAATSGGGDVPPEPVDYVKINFTTEGCKVYKDNKAITTDEAIKDDYQAYTIKLDDEYKKDYDLSEYSLKIYTLDGEEYDSTRYTLNYDSGTLLINPSEEVNVTCRATLAVTKFACVCSDTEENYASVQLIGSFDYIDWGDGTSHTPYAPGINQYDHEYEGLEIGDEFVIRIVGEAYAINSLTGEALGPSYLKEAYFGHYVKSFNSQLMAATPVENVYFEDGITTITTISLPQGSDYNSLKSIRIPDTVTYLSGTFRNVPFEEISIPDNVMTIGNGLCTNSAVKNVNFSNNSKLTTLLPQALANNKVFEEITLPKHVKRIDMQAFFRSAKLKTLDLSLLEEYLPLDIITLILRTYTITFFMSAQA